MLRIGLIGCGTHAHWAVFPALQACSDVVEWVAASDIHAPSMDDLPEGIAPFTDHKQMIAESNLDAVYIATLPDTHAPIAEDAFAAGLHVISEKPMADTVANCQRMVDAAAKHDRLLAVDFELRFADWARQIRQWVAEGVIGRVEAVHIQEFWDGHKTFGPRAERRLRLCRLAGSLDCGIHRADLVRYYTGGGNWEHVEALGAWFGEDTPLPPHTAVLAQLDTGVMATLNISFAYTAYSKGTHHIETHTLLGDKGSIHIDFWLGEGPRITLVDADSEEPTVIDMPKASKPIPDLIREFAANIAGNPPELPSIATGNDGLIAQQFTDRANASAVARRKTVTTSV